MQDERSTSTLNAEWNVLDGMFLHVFDSHFTKKGDYESLLMAGWMESHQLNDKYDWISLYVLCKGFQLFYSLYYYNTIKVISGNTCCIRNQCNTSVLSEDLSSNLLLQWIDSLKTRKRRISKGKTDALCTHRKCRKCNWRSRAQGRGGVTFPSLAILGESPGGNSKGHSRISNFKCQINPF